MSASWRDDDEEYKVGGARGGLRSKPRFSFTEVKMLLEAVKRNRYIILRKFNHGVSAETKKQTWAEITEQINGLGENHREVRQIMKKWADLKCDGKRRIVALRGPNGNNMRKKNLGPVEKMVHKILMMSPRGDGDSDLEFDDDDISKLYGKGPSSPPPSYSYLSLTDASYSLPGGASLDMSPLSSPEKDLGGDPFHSSSDFDLDQTEDGDRTMDFDENDDSLFSSYPPSAPPPPPSSTSMDDAPLRTKPVHTYSRSSSSQNHNSSTSPKPPPGPSSDTSSSSSSSAAAPPPPPPPHPPTSPNKTASSAPAPPPASKPATDSDSTPRPSSSPPPPSAPPASSSSSSSSAPAAPQRPPVPASGSNPSDPLPPGASSRRTADHVAQMAAQSLQQQRAGRLLLSSVSQSLEALAQSVQLLVESQQEFVQESLQLQRDTVEVLRDFSNTALTMLRDKTGAAAAAQHQPAPRY